MHLIRVESKLPPVTEFDTCDLEQGSTTLYLEIYFPAVFSSNPNQTRLNQLIKVFKNTAKLQVGVVPVPM